MGLSDWGCKSAGLRRGALGSQPCHVDKNRAWSGIAVRTFTNCLIAWSLCVATHTHIPMTRAINHGFHQHTVTWSTINSKNISHFSSDELVMLQCVCVKQLCVFGVFSSNMFGGSL